MEGSVAKKSIWTCPVFPALDVINADSGGIPQWTTLCPQQRGPVVLPQDCSHPTYGNEAAVNALIKTILKINLVTISMPIHDILLISRDSNFFFGFFRLT